MATFAGPFTMAQIGQDIDRAVEILNSGGLVGIPTETVYGLAGNAINEHAILKIYQAKNRPHFDPLIAHIDSISKLSGLVTGMPDQAKLLVHRFWPGPLTLLLPKTSKVPDPLTSGLDRMAIRVPGHPLALALLKMLDYPLAAPSANPFGYVSPTQASHVNDQLGHKIDYILDGGECGIGLESTILGFEHEKPVVYRLGGTSLESIEEVIGEVGTTIHTGAYPAAPGMLKSHYSPGKTMWIGDIQQELKKYPKKSTGIISFSSSFDVPKENLFILSPNGHLEEAARNIFKALRAMDRLGIDVVLTEYVPERGLGRAINDRLRRSAVKD